MQAREIRVWDPLVRIFHWSLVASFATAWLTAESWDQVHEWAGYMAGALVAFRLVWGLVGPRYARFGQFVRSPAGVRAYLHAMLRRREPRYIGHNPAGGAMVVALLLAMAGTATTGWMLTLDAFWGSGLVQGVHETLANLLLVLVGLHVLGVIYASLRHGENLVRAMIHGRKQAPGPEDIA